MLGELKHDRIEEPKIKCYTANERKKLSATKEKENTKTKDWYPKPLQPSLDQDTQVSDMVARLRPHTTDINGRIINTLLELQKAGLADNTLTSISASLRQLSRHADLNNPESIKEHIARAALEFQW